MKNFIEYIRYITKKRIFRTITFSIIAITIFYLMSLKGW